MARENSGGPEKAPGWISEKLQSIMRRVPHQAAIGGEPTITHRRVVPYPNSSPDLEGLVTRSRPCCSGTRSGSNCRASSTPERHDSTTRCGVGPLPATRLTLPHHLQRSPFGSLTVPAAKLESLRRRFISVIRQETGEEFTTFADCPWLHGEETDYKHAIWAKGSEALGLSDWPQLLESPGGVCDRVANAMRLARGHSGL